MNLSTGFVVVSYTDTIGNTYLLDTFVLSRTMQ